MLFVSRLFTAPTLLFGLLSVVAVAVGAQEPPAGPGPSAIFGETLDVDLVTLDVVAVDRDGRPVTDLEAEEIEVLEDGKPVELTSFDPPPAAVPRGEPGAASPVSKENDRPATTADDTPSNLVVFVDNVHIGAANRDRFFRELWAFLSEQAPPGTRTLVASYGESLSFLTGPTNDRDEIRGALERALQAPALQIMADHEQRAGIQAVQERQRAAVDNPYEEACPPDLGTLAEQFAETARQRTGRALDSLRFLIATLGGIDGQKVLVHVSDGIPLVPGQPVLDYAISLCDGTLAREGTGAGFQEDQPGKPLSEAYAIDVYSKGSDRYAMLDPGALRMAATRFSVQDELAAVTRLATSNRVRLFTFKASAPATGGAEAGDGIGKLRTGSSRFQESRNQGDSLFYLAEETGGRAFLAGTGFDRDLETLREHLTATYSLSYRSPSGRDGATHRLKVRTSRPGVRILHPAHRQSKTLQDEVGDLLLAALHHGETRNPHRAALELVPATEGAAPTRLRLRLPARAASLPLPAGGSHGMLDIYVTTVDEKGRSSGLRKQTHPIHLPAGEAPPESILVEIEMGTDLTDHRVAVAVHDQLQSSLWTLLGEPGTTPR